MANPIRTLADYVSEVTLACKPTAAFRDTTAFWFRGQRDSAWKLTPSLYRGKFDPKREREMVRDFKLRSSAYLTTYPENDLEWHFVMQHYGLETRLLDWTESHLAALYFAVYDLDPAFDATVWILHPWTLNGFTISKLSVPVTDNDIVSGYKFDDSLEDPSTPKKFYISAEMPAAIRPRHTTERIIAQKGQFTIHGRNTTGIDQIANTFQSSPLRRIEIPGQAKEGLVKELFMAGVTHAVLFPDLEGLAKEISLRYSVRFMR